MRGGRGSRNPPEDSGLLERAAKVLARAARSRKELEGRLRRWGASPEAAARVLARLEELGLLDDEVYARQRAVWLAEAKGRAAPAIFRDLLARGVEASLARRAAEEAAPGAREEARARALTRFWMERSSLDREVLARRVYARLLSRGYSPEVARRVAGELVRGVFDPTLHRG